MDKRTFQFSLADVFAATSAMAVLLVPLVYLPFGGAMALFGCIAAGLFALRWAAPFLVAASLLLFVVGIRSLAANANGQPVGGSALLAALVLAAASRKLKFRALRRPAESRPFRAAMFRYDMNPGLRFAPPWAIE